MENLIVGKSHSGDTLRMSKEKWDEYKEALKKGDYQRITYYRLKYNKVI